MNNRQIDALVAERIMGWGWLRFPSGVHLRGEVRGNAVLVPPGYAVPPTLGPGYLEFTFEVPPYSEDIAAAWQLVEKMPDDPRPKGERFYESGGLVIKRLADTLWFAGWYQIIPYEGEAELTKYSGVADTAPMAICLAALKAHGIEVPE